LRDAVSDLAQHVHVLIDALDDIREDLSFITRNGVPGGRPLEHTRVVRMARDPLADDAREHLELRTYTLEPHGPPALTPEDFETLVAEIAEAMTVVGQEQLNMFLTALDCGGSGACRSPTGLPFGFLIAAISLDRASSMSSVDHHFTGRNRLRSRSISSAISSLRTPANACKMIVAR